MLTLVFCLLLRSKVVNALKLSPIRVLRIVCGVLVLLGFLIPIIMPGYISTKSLVVLVVSEYDHPVMTVYSTVMTSVLLSSFIALAYISRKAAEILVYAAVAGIIIIIIITIIIIIIIIINIIRLSIARC